MSWRTPTKQIELTETTLHNQEFGVEGGVWLGVWETPGDLSIGVGNFFLHTPHLYQNLVTQKWFCGQNQNTAKDRRYYAIQTLLDFLTHLGESLPWASDYTLVEKKGPGWCSNLVQVQFLPKFDGISEKSQKLPFSSHERESEQERIQENDRERGGKE